VLENTAGNNQFPTPGTGKIIRIDRSAADNRVTITGGLDLPAGLDLPTGMTLGPDKKLYVSVWGFGAALGSGQILQIDLKD